MYVCLYVYVSPRLPVMKLFRFDQYLTKLFHNPFCFITSIMTRFVSQCKVSLNHLWIYQRYISYANVLFSLLEFQLMYVMYIIVRKL